MNGFVAGRGISNTTLGDSQSYGARTFHVARCNITSLQVATSNWVVVNNSSPYKEISTGGNLTVFGCIEYPVGTFHSLTYNGGSASASVAPLTTNLSDSLTITIPVGSTFFYWTWQTCVGGTIGYCQINSSGQADYPPGGDAMQQTNTNVTLSHTITDGFTGNACIYPTAIIGPTNQPSIAGASDSRFAGIGDSVPNSSGAIGELAHGVSANYAYINMACPGEVLSDFVNTSNSSLRRALMDFGSHIVVGYGINDVRAGATAASIISNMETVIAQFAPKPVYWTTLSPACSGTSDNWTTVGGQSVGFNDAARVAVNAAIRGGTVTGLAGFVDVAGVMEFGSSSKWNVTGSPPPNSYTADGLHETSFAYNLISVPAGFFTLPNQANALLFGSDAE